MKPTILTIILAVIVAVTGCKTQQQAKTIEIAKVNTSQLTPVKGYFYISPDGSLYVYVSGKAKFYKVTH